MKKARVQADTGFFVQLPLGEAHFPTFSTVPLGQERRAGEIIEVDVEPVLGGAAAALSAELTTLGTLHHIHELHHHVHHLHHHLPLRTFRAARALGAVRTMGAAVAAGFTLSFAFSRALATTASDLGVMTALSDIDIETRQRQREEGQRERGVERK